MKRLAVLAGIALASPLAASAAPQQPLLGIVGKTILAQQLVRFDAATLGTRGRRLALGGHRYGWSFSPDGTKVVLGSGGAACPTTLRVVDVSGMRTVRDVDIAAGGVVQETVWLGPTRVAAAVGGGRCGAAQTRIVTVDVASGRVLGRTWLRGSVLGSTRTSAGAVLLLAGFGLGPARVAVVDATGAVRTKLVEAVAAGQTRERVATPGFAVDPAGRAFLFTGWDGVAEVDLRTLRVAYHRLSARTVAKTIRGFERAALWLGNGRLALTGSDFAGEPKPIGLRILDTRTWTTTALDPDVARVQLAGGLLIGVGRGLVAYSPAGRELYRIFDGSPVGRVAVVAGRGYATVGGAAYENRTVEFDPATGAPGRSLDQPLWELLL